MTIPLVTFAAFCLAADGAAPDAGADGRLDAGADAAVDAPPVPAAPVPRGALDLQVFERGTRRPVSGAALSLGVGELGETDRQGRFQTTLPCGPRRFGVQAPGFERFAFERDVCAAGAPLVLRLVPRGGAAGYETVVRAPTSRQEIHVEGEEITHTPGTLGDPFRVVETLPGVASVAWPAPVYAVRGGNPGNTGFLLDELPVPALFHFALGPAVIHPYFFEGLDFYPGGAPAKYGRFVSGLVSGRTRAAPDDAVHASVDVRLIDAGALVTAPLPGGGSVAAAGRYSYTGAIIGLLSPDVTLAYWDYQLRVDRPAGPFHLTLLAFGSSDTLNTGETGPTTGSLALQFHRLKLRADVPLAGGHVAASVGLGFDHTDVPLSQLTPLRMLVDSWSLLPRLAYTRPSRLVDFELGFDGGLQRYVPIGVVERPGPLDLGRERTVRLLAGYVTVLARVGGRVIVTPELRLDSYTISGATRSDLGPRLSTRVALDDRTWLRAMAGRYTQPPNPRPEADRKRFMKVSERRT